MTAYPPNSPADRIHRSIERDDLFAASLREQDAELAQIEEMSSAEISSELKKLGLSSRPGLRETKAMLGLISADDLDDDKISSGQQRASFWKWPSVDFVKNLASNIHNQMNASLVAGSVACLAIALIAKKDAERAEDTLRIYKDRISIAEEWTKSAEKNKASIDAYILSLKQELAEISTKSSIMSDLVRENSKIIRDDAKVYSASLNRIETGVATLLKSNGSKSDPPPLVNMEWIDNEKEFKESVIRISNYEIQSSQIALSKTRAVDIRSYAQEVLRDFRAVNVALIGVDRGYSTVSSGPAIAILGALVGSPANSGVSTAGSAGVETTGTSGPVPLTAEQQENLVKLSVAKAGVDFEQMYIDQQAKSLWELDKVIRRFEQDNSKSSLGNFAQQLMPTVIYNSQKVQNLKARFSR